MYIENVPRVIKHLPFLIDWCDNTSKFVFICNNVYFEMFILFFGYLFNKDFNFVIFCIVFMSQSHLYVNSLGTPTARQITIITIM